MNDETLKHILWLLTIEEDPSKKDALLASNFNGRTAEDLFAYWREKIDSSPVYMSFAKEHLKRWQAMQARQKTKDEQVAANIALMSAQSRLPAGERNRIAWLVTCYNEPEYVDQCVSSIRRNDCGPILVINDGGDSASLESICDQSKATLIEGEHLKTPERGFEWWTRFFNHGIATGMDFMVKMDPDAYFHRPLELSTKGLDFFGTVTDRADRSPHSVQGGIQGFSLDLAQKTLTSGLLEDSKGSGLRTDGSFSTDVFISGIMRKLNQFGQPWMEIMSVWGMVQKLGNTEGYAITHPHALMSDGGGVVAEQHPERFKVCQECSFFEKMNCTCNSSGKYVLPLTKIPSESCPKHKW